ncbi:hypothetical protein [Schumannella sp. 10F1B-5-1]|uniref:hypothetical protein n=1 Tax=Schumannella sp. 10F1B-5-1 TaxID=2590780 RepID=UPI001131A232|nr:hypothetical protein [Schumannella sp. 10F1B-5-1]TPW76695.1 hypothetical protein FJ658_01760 [Schumannella sp. 10F1B-5-1]
MIGDPPDAGLDAGDAEAVAVVDDTVSVLRRGAAGAAVDEEREWGAPARRQHPLVGVPGRRRWRSGVLAFEP